MLMLLYLDSASPSYSWICLGRCGKPGGGLIVIGLSCLDMLGWLWKFGGIMVVEWSVPLLIVVLEIDLACRSPRGRRCLAAPESDSSGRLGGKS